MKLYINGKNKKKGGNLKGKGQNSNNKYKKKKKKNKTVGRIDANTSKNG